MHVAGKHKSRLSESHKGPTMLPCFPPPPFLREHQPPSSLSLRVSYKQSRLLGQGIATHPSCLSHLVSDSQGLPMDSGQGEDTSEPRVLSSQFWGPVSEGL